MRISQDTDSWKASGVLRRDFRHTLGEPEVERHKGKKTPKPRKARKPFSHKHVFVDVTGTSEAPWWFRDRLPWSSSYCSPQAVRRWCERYKGQRILRCAQPFCDEYRIRKYS